MVLNLLRRFGLRESVVARRSGIHLDIGCGASKQGPTWVGMDIRSLPGVDIVWDFNVHPWPLDDESVITAIASHVLEHIPGSAIGKDGHSRAPFMEFMADMWRVMRVGGEFMIAVPHGNSPGFMQDPTHCNMMNEARWAYFDPLEPNTGGQLWAIYRPPPWRLKYLAWDPTANMEVVLVKRAWTDEFRKGNPPFKQDGQVVTYE